MTFHSRIATLALTVGTVMRADPACRGVRTERDVRREARVSSTRGGSPGLVAGRPSSARPGTATSRSASCRQSTEPARA